MDTEKIHRIEMALAHQAKQIDDLSEMTYTQGQKIAFLERQLAMTKQQLSDMESSVKDAKSEVGLSGLEIATLNKPSIIVMDNATFHKKADIFECLKNAGHFFLPLPPYSPDFNPIEKAFATLKKIRQSKPNQPVINIIKSSDYYLK